jgi:hypothetical protein
MNAPALRLLLRRDRLIFAAVLLVCVGSLASAQNSDRPANTAGPRLGASTQREAPAAGAPGPTKPADRLREGTRLTDELGVFQSSGDRVAFLPAGVNKDSYRVLENLALQRVGIALDEGRGQGQWLVSGIITEFRGANYLLLTKAVIPPQEKDAATGR